MFAVVRCLLFAGCYLLVVRCMMLVAYYSLCVFVVVCCLFVVVRCLWFVVPCGAASVARCALFVDCSLLCFVFLLFVA